MIKKLSTVSSREVPSLPPPHKRYVTSDSQGKHSTSCNNHDQLKMQKAKNQRLIKELVATRTLNRKLQEEIKMAKMQIEHYRLYVRKMEGKLVDRAGEFDYKFLVQESQNRLKSKDKQIQELKEKVSELSLLYQQNATLRKFVDKPGKNISKQILLLENCKADLQKRVRQLQIELEVTRQEPSEDYVQSQHDLNELKFYLDQKDEYCAKLLRENKELREIRDSRVFGNTNQKKFKKTDRGNLKWDLINIIGASFPELVDKL